MATTAAQPRYRKGRSEAGSASLAAEDAQSDPNLMKGLLSCIAGVGGVSIVLWLMFFVFLEPYDPNKLPCTNVGTPAELDGALVTFEAVGFNWRLYGEELGVPPEKLNTILYDNGDDSHDEIAAVLRLWYESTRKPCWESAVQALLRMEERKSAERLAKKFKVYWKGASK